MPLASRTGALEDLRGAIEAARQAWPQLTVRDEVFASYLLARTEGTKPEELQVADLYLACACVEGDPRALTELDRAFLRPLEPFLMRSGVAASAVPEVLQQVRQRLLVANDGGRPRIAEYLGKGSLAGWLRVVTARAALDLGRGERTLRRVENAVPAPSQALGASPEDRLLAEQHRATFDRAFREAFAGLAVEERLLLRLHFVEGLNLEALAVAANISRATAGRRMLAARTRLREATLHLLAERLEAPASDVERVLAALRSHLDISMSALISSH
jgi:RNA polymerase sigma-70 factor (ECF subfamily)